MSQSHCRELLRIYFNVPLYPVIKKILVNNVYCRHALGGLHAPRQVGLLELGRQALS
jgi:hypothetical protein